MQMSDAETIVYTMEEEEVASLEPSSSHTPAPARAPSPPLLDHLYQGGFTPTGVAAGVGGATQEEGEGVGEGPHPQHQQPLAGGLARAK